MGHTLTIATVQTGSTYPDAWVEHLANMVAQHLSQPHRFVIYTDRPDLAHFGGKGPAHLGHQQRQALSLGSLALKGFFNKLRLFDRALTGSDSFLYLDTTLVIRSSLQPLIELGQTTTASLIGVRDWNYPILNSCVLWCRPDAHTQAVWDAWQQDRYADIAFPGDQNFIFHVFRESAPDALTYWPEELVCSYKRLRKLAARDPQAAQRQLENCAILKFHGRPKPEEVLHPWRHPQHTILRHPLQPKLWGYLAGEIRNHWH